MTRPASEMPPARGGLDPEMLISHLLRLGVSVSFGLVMLGVTFTFLHHPDYRVSSDALHRLIAPTDLPRTLGTVLEDCLAERGQAFVLLGLTVLVATPIVRVAMSILIFYQQRDRVFVAVTAAVLTLLLLSLVVGGEGRSVPDRGRDTVGANP